MPRCMGGGDRARCLCGRRYGAGREGVDGAHHVFRYQERKDQVMDRAQERIYKQALALAKEEIALACVKGIRDHMNTMRGARLLGASAKTDVMPDSLRTVQVECTVEGVPTVFEFTVRELLGKGM